MQPVKRLKKDKFKQLERSVTLYLNSSTVKLLRRSPLTSPPALKRRILSKQRTGLNTLASGTPRLRRDTAEACKFGPMDRFMKAIGKVTWPTAEVD